eukprot:TRINITY_DN16462_c0_g1_i1.p1 TRINITY_DN16462_c0_g1~~TRINITY_DN16462_c0_g1_i1.p1  ORF type:complete len:853 (+),score=329.40 TRINITY_DN16462_c0_g1_i1:365-2923(+)
MSLGSANPGWNADTCSPPPSSLRPHLASGMTVCTEQTDGSARRAVGGSARKEAGRKTAARNSVVLSSHLKATESVDRIANELHIRAPVVRKELAAVLSPARPAGVSPKAAAASAAKTEAGRFSPPIPVQDRRPAQLQMPIPSVPHPGTFVTAFKLLHHSPTSDFTLGSVDDDVVRELAREVSREAGRRGTQPSLSARGSARQSETARAASPTTSSSFAASVESDRTEMFPVADDAVWASIPQLVTTGADDIADEDAPLLGRVTVLPPGADALLGHAKGAINQWVQQMPQMRTRADLCVVQQGSGEAVCAAVPMQRSDSAGGETLKKRLALPRLPNEVKDLRLYSAPGPGGEPRVMLTVTLNRSPLAFAALLAATAAEVGRTYLCLTELRKADSSRHAPFDTPISLIEVWLQEAVLAFSVLLFLGQWVMGDLSDGRFWAYTASGYGAVRIAAMAVAAALWLVPLTFYSGAGGSHNICYCAGVAALLLARLASSASVVVVRDWLAAAALTAAVVVCAWLPDGFSDGTAAGEKPFLRYLTLTGGSVASAAAVGSMRLVRPHVPMSMIMLWASLGSLLGSTAFALEEDSSGNVFAGWVYLEGEPSWRLGLLAGLRIVAMSCVAWCVRYLSPTPMVAGVAAQRVVAVCLRAAVEDDGRWPLVAVAMVFAAVGLFMACDAGYRDDERTLELRTTALDRTASAASIQSSQTARAGAARRPSAPLRLGSLHSPMPAVVSDGVTLQSGTTAQPPKETQAAESPRRTAASRSDPPGIEAQLGYTSGWQLPLGVSAGGQSLESFGPGFGAILTPDFGANALRGDTPAGGTEPEDRTPPGPVYTQTGAHSSPQRPQRDDDDTGL